LKPGEERSGQLAVDIYSQVDFMRAFTYPHDNTPDSCIAGLTGIGLESVSYGTHSMRGTKAIQIYRKIVNPPRDSAPSLPHEVETTVRYLGIEVDDALNIAEQIEL
jgi:hypothetical protein